MKIALAGGLLVFGACLPLRADQVSPAAAATNIADAIRWYDTLGFPDTNGLPYVRAATGEWARTGNAPRRNTYVEGFLVGEEADAFTVLVSDVPIYPDGSFPPHEPYPPLSVVRLLKNTAGPPEERVQFEEIDFQARVDDTLARLRARPLGHFNSLAYRPWSLRVRLFAFARACLQRGFLAEGDALMGIVTGLPDPNGGKPPTQPLRDVLEREMGDAVWWETEKMFGNPAVSWAEIRQSYEEFVEYYPASFKVPDARERDGLLRAMAAEDAAHPPGSFDALPRATHAAEAIYQLRNVRTLFWVMNQPYPVMSRTGDGRDVITPVHRLVDLGDAAVPALIEAVDDQRFTRSMTPSFNGLDAPMVMRVSDFARGILEFMSGRNLFPRRADNGTLQNGTTREQAEAWWAERKADGEEQTLVAQSAGGGQNGRAAVRRIVEKYPGAAIDAINAGIRVAENELVRGELVALASALYGDATLAFLRSKLAPGAGVPSQVAAARILFERGQPEALPAMIDAWRTIQPRLPANEGDAYDEVGDLIAFLAKSGDAGAIEALGRDMRNAPIDVRFAVVRVFLPRPLSAGSFRSGKGVRVDADMPNLPAGAAGAAIERLLVAALDDTNRRFGTKGYYDDASYEDPRLSDLAAFVLSKRWPAKYQFQWSPNAAECDAQIEVTRNTWLLESSNAPR